MKEDIPPDPTKVAALTQKIVGLLLKETSETRHRAINAALTVLGETAVERPLKGAPGASKQHDSIGSTEGLASLIGTDDKLKPSENAYLCAAYHYSVYGNATFSLEDLRDIAREAGVVVPDRLDMTIKQAAKGGKKFFQSTGRDTYKPTTAGGLFFAERWKIKPGKKSKEAGA